MGELGFYDLSEVSYSVDLEEAGERDEESDIAGSQDYSGRSVPDKVIPEIDGVNSSEMNIGYMENGEWVLMKSGSANMGKAAAAHLGAYAVLDETELNLPKLDYSDGQIIIEHLGDLQSPASAINQDVDRYDSFVEAIAGKAILGDSDIGGNIGFAQGEFYVYDFDRAGSLIRGVEGSVYDHIRRIDRLTEAEACMGDVETAMEDISESFNLSELQSNLDRLLDSIDQEADRRVMRLTAGDFVGNIRDVREGKFFNSDLCDRIDSLDEEDGVKDNDTLKRSLQEIMLD